MRGKVRNMLCLVVGLMFAVYGGDMHASDGYSNTRWETGGDGVIKWSVADDVPHYDHMEMSGEKVSAVLRYGVDADGAFSMERSVV